MARENSIVTCGMDELLFPVEMIDNPIRTNSEYSKIVRGQITEKDEDGNKIQVPMDLNYCSPRYELVKNKNIFPNVENVLKANGISFDASYKHLNHVRFYGDIVINDKKFEYDVNNNGDIVKPKLSIQHSYNGLTKYTIVFGYFRMVCSNGLVIPLEEMRMFNLQITGKHTSSILASIEKLNDMLVYFSQNAETIIESITEKFEILGGHWVSNPQDRIKEVMEVAGLSVIENSKFNTVNDIMNKIYNEANNPSMGYDGKINDWLIYNGINQYINDEKRTIEVPEKRREKDSKIFESLLATV